ncbi:uroporphyrinogen-III C-methyltransferase [Rhizobium leguminosarum]|nr:uroporphyrinogen-III C-methyltransferase [Rhizobium leguminosarum]
MIDAAFSNLPALEPGSVWLVGAGPGDPGLFDAARRQGAFRGRRHRARRFGQRGMPALARPETLVEYAGKRGGKPSAKQRDISLRLVELARAGKRVLRLKGGDPFVFGRGGEEALTLVEHNIPFRIVPGITAGIGGLAYAGIPVTHRDINHAVTFLTGHDSSGIVPDRINWEAIGQGSPVIVMYMAMKHIAEISARLIAAGRLASEPVAFVCNAATGRQQVLETTLGEATEAVAVSGLEPPAVVVVGEVVRLRASLDWLGALAGRRLQPDPFRRSGKVRA